MPDFVLPALAEHTVSATLTQWLRQDGDSVEPGDDLVEVETDKATSVLQADATGTLVILVPAGETVEVGTPVARIGQDVAAGVPVAVDVPEAAPGFADTPPAALLPDEVSEIRLPGLLASARQEASPVARRLAASARIELSSVRGSGPKGRILKRDVLAASSAQTNGGLPATALANPAQANSEPMSRLRQLVAARMVESNTTIPDFAVETEVDMTACRALRQQMAALDRGPVPSYNDMVIKAAALALRAFPKANSSMDGDAGITLHERVSLAFAVSAGDDLFAPVIADADQLPLGDIARVSRELIAKVKDATIEPRELSGATFTVSNLGMFGVTRFIAVVTPPQAAILAVGAVRETPVVRDGELAVGPQMSITLSSDHRIIYGADAARFVQHIRATLEQPAAFLL
jgi:pyruvate dehydrogenase E2 component (dihydrolipoamide acetyltransferase)